VVENTGDLEGSFDVILLINGQEEARETVTLEGLSTIPAIFDVTKAEPGTYDIRIEDLEGSFKVISVPTAVFSLSNLRVSPETVAAGEEVTITVTLANTGDAAGSRTVTLKINGVVEATQDITLSADASRSVEFKVTRDQAGVYNVEVDGQLSSFEVTVPLAPLGPPMGMIIGIVVVVILIGAGAAVYFLVLRRRPPTPPGEGMPPMAEVGSPPPGEGSPEQPTTGAEAGEAVPAEEPRSAPPDEQPSDETGRDTS